MMTSTHLAEQVAARAVGGGVEVIGAIAVACETLRPQQAGGLAVGLVAVRAVLVFGERVQTRELGRRMARRARRGRCNAARPVGAVAIGAIVAELAVRRQRFFGVAARARFGNAAAVGLVAVQACLMAARGRAVLGGVTRAALARHAAGVRLVAVETFGVALGHLVVHAAVARRAADLERFGAVRKPAVTIGTYAVSGVRGSVRYLSAVAAAAGLGFAEGEDEVMRRVALLACDSRVKVFVVTGDLVAGAARTGAAHGVNPGGVGRVATDAGPRRAFVRVVGMHAGVTARAGSGRAPGDVVRGVTVGTGAVRRHAGAAEHVQRIVTGRARDGVCGVEVVRSVAPHAFAMPGLEQRRFRYFGFLSSVAVDTAFPGDFGAGVLALMTGDADLGHGTAAGGVLGRNVGVAGLARSGLRLGVFVRVVAGRAFLSVVHRYRGHVADRRRVAARAVAGTLDLGGRVGRLPSQVHRERVTAGTVRRRVRPELCSRLLLRMYELGFFRVAGRAPLRHDRTHFVVADGVTRRTFHPVSNDVNFVTIDLSRRLPTQRHVHTVTRSAARFAVGSGTSAGQTCDDKADQEQQREPAPFKLHHGCRIIAALRVRQDARDLRRVDLWWDSVRDNFAGRPVRSALRCVPRTGTNRMRQS